ncbi:MAG: hypothetical protein ACJ8EF_12135, partial [Bradyrhizobium sp.]
MAQVDAAHCFRCFNLGSFCQKRSGAEVNRSADQPAFQLKIATFNITTRGRLTRLLLDHLICKRHQGRRHLKTDGLGGLQVD